MKAPERLYLRKRNKLPLEVVRDVWYETDPQSPFGSVGYTRTDAFVEKACEFLKDHLAGYDICEDDIERSVESFKLAMKL